MLTTAQQIEAWPQTIAEFERLVEVTQDDLVNFAFYQLGNQADAEDAVQDVYVQAYRDRAKRKKITDVRPYLFAVTWKAPKNSLTPACYRGTTGKISAELPV
jgi:RNA polymerase sigma-70 factor (ECF subfamily)